MAFKRGGEGEELLARGLRTVPPKERRAGLPTVRAPNIFMLTTKLPTLPERGRPAHSADVLVDYTWPDPYPLERELLRVEAFDKDIFPEALGAFAYDVAELMQAPIDCVAAAVIVTLAGAVNRRARIQPKALDTSWSVVPNLYGVYAAEAK
jgi:hypothetical protein